MLFAMAMIVFALLRWWAAKLGAVLTGLYGRSLRQGVHARLIDAPMASLAGATSAEITHVLTHNVEVIRQGFNALLQLLVAGATSVVSLAFAFWVSPALMLVLPPVAIILLLTSRFFGRRQLEVSRRYTADIITLFWHGEDLPRRLRHVRSFQREEAEKASYDETSVRLGHGYRRQLELLANERLILEVLAGICIAGMFVLAHHWRGEQPSSLIAIGLLLGRLLPYVVSARQSFQQLRSAAPAFELWERYMDLAPDRPPAAAMEVGGRGAIHIEHIRIAPPYPCLDIFDLRLIPGQMTLVAGESGIGKSSLVDVLAGITRPVAFAAHEDGHALDFDAYRQRVRHGAYVSQQMQPWHRTVRESLRWAAPHASEEAMWSALVDVDLERRLVKSSHGLDTAIDNSSSRFSGGELQRLLLAQVILRRPALAVLDEATSALDAASELSVLSVLHQRLPATVMIVVSHRSNVEEVADQVLSIDGKVQVVRETRMAVR
jgi:ATP-binding cassette subfamily C protein